MDGSCVVVHNLIASYGIRVTERSGKFTCLCAGAAAAAHLLGMGCVLAIATSNTSTRKYPLGTLEECRVRTRVRDSPRAVRGDRSGVHTFIVFEAAVALECFHMWLYAW